MKARKNVLNNDVNYMIARIRLEIRKLYDKKKVKKIDISMVSGKSRAYFDDVIKGESAIDVRILLAINRLLDEKINWFDLKDDGIVYKEEIKENTIVEEPNSINMTDTEKEFLLALRMITGELKEMRKDVDDLKQTGSS